MEIQSMILDAYQVQLFLNLTFEYLEMVSYTFLFYHRITKPEENVPSDDCLYLFVFWLIADMLELREIIRTCQETTYYVSII